MTFTVGDQVRIRPTDWLIPDCWANPSSWTGTVVRVENTGVEVRPDEQHQFRVVKKGATYTTLWFDPGALDLLSPSQESPHAQIPQECRA